MTLNNCIKLIRPINLLIIVLTMCVCRYALLFPFLSKNKMAFEQPLWAFLLLTLACSAVAAYGYIVNDIEDIESDRINGKAREFLKTNEAKEKAKSFAFNILISALFLGLLSWYIAGNIVLFAIHLFAAGSLYFYSKQLQKTLLLGNLNIALLCAVLPLLVFAFDMPSVIQKYYHEVSVYFIGDDIKTYNEDFFKVIFKHVLSLCLFIFLITLQREIVKDIQDIKGDASAAYKTLPIRFGVKTANQLSTFLAFVLCFLFAQFLIAQVNWILSFENFIIASIAAFFLIILPQIQSVYNAIKNKFKKSSNNLKISMIGAILFWCVFAILF